MTTLDSEALAHVQYIGIYCNMLVKISKRLDELRPSFAQGIGSACVQYIPPQRLRRKGKKEEKRNGDFVFKEDESVSVVRANVYTYMHMQVE